MEEKKVEIFSGKLRIHLLCFQGENSIGFRAIGENQESGVEEALVTVGRIERHCRAVGIRHEAYQRKYGTGKRTDAVVIQLPAGRRQADRRRRERRRTR